MKSKNIPPVIKEKTVKEAQNEIKSIIEMLENKDTNLEDSIEHYNRMIKLNNHIHNKFKQKSNEIRQSGLVKKRKKNTKRKK